MKYLFGSLSILIGLIYMAFCYQHAEQFVLFGKDPGVCERIGFVFIAVSAAILFVALMVGLYGLGEEVYTKLAKVKRKRYSNEGPEQVKFKTRYRNGGVI
jgi:hypothetical protein